LAFKLARELVLPLAAVLICWSLLSLWLTPQLLPGPVATSATLARDIASRTLWYHLGTTLTRVGLSFALAMAVGTPLGIAMGLFPRLDGALNSLLIVGLNLPVLVVSVALYIALGLNEWAAILAVSLNKLPIVTVNLREGTRALEPQYAELARSFRLSSPLRLRRIVLPQLLPYLLVSARTGLALIWKIVLVVEFLGRSDGIGFQIHLFFQNYDMAQVLAYTLVLVSVMLLIDYGILQPLDRRLFAWRGPDGRRR
jgi:NitT/TauT family transport system permease protein